MTPLLAALLLQPADGPRPLAEQHGEAIRGLTERASVPLELQVRHRRRDNEVVGAIREHALGERDDAVVEAHRASAGFSASASRSSVNAS